MNRWRSLAANRVVREVLALTGISPGDTGGPPSRGPEAHEIRVGRMIGNLERLIILTLMLRGDSALAVGLVLTAKFVARFDDLRDRRRAEYYIVGTLTSVLVALAVASAVAMAAS